MVNDKVVLPTVHLSNELIAEILKSTLGYIQSLFRRDAAANELPSTDEIQEEVDVVRQELYENGMAIYFLIRRNLPYRMNGLFRTLFCYVYFLNVN